MPDLDINFQWVSNAQSLQAKPREIITLGENFARMIVDEVALAASAESFARARRSFISSVKMAIRTEVSRMAMLIGRFVPLPDKYTGPNGQMSLGERSATAAQFRFEEHWNRKQANIQWKKRSPRYLSWKKRHNKPAKWWENSGGLKRGLMAKKASFYEDTFGPIRVRFIRPPAQRIPRGQKGAGRFAATNRVNTNAVNPVSPEAGASNRVNVIAPGRRGKISAEYRVGTLEVDVFGKITPQMLPALAGKTMNPKGAEPTGGEGVVGLFPNDGKGGLRNKLLGDRTGPHKRWAIEPFVSFYLTRAIPNAVWRRTERIILQQKGGRSSGLSDQFAV